MNLLVLIPPLALVVWALYLVATWLNHVTAAVPS